MLTFAVEWKPLDGAPIFAVRWRTPITGDANGKLRVANTELL
jgi:hypothetical protein